MSAASSGVFATKLSGFSLSASFSGFSLSASFLLVAPPLEVGDLAGEGLLRATLLFCFDSWDGDFVDDFAANGDISFLMDLVLEGVLSSDWLTEATF